METPASGAVLRIAVVVALALAACSSGEDDAAPPSSSTTTSTTSAADGPDWSRPCIDTTGTAGEARGAAKFGPLGAEPALVVELPLADLPAGTEHHEVDRYPWVQPARVDGGVALGVSARYPSEVGTSIVAVVNDDGTIRWVRCLPGTIEQLWAAEGAGTVLVAGDTWHRLAVDDGETHPLPELDGFDPVVWDAPPSTSVLVGLGEPGFSLERLIRYDLAGDRLERVEVPDEARRQVACAPVLGMTGGGDPIVHGPPAGGIAPIAAIWRDGWSSDARTIDAAVPLRAVGTCDQPLTLVGATGSGLIRWERPDLEHPGLEGNWLVQDAETAVMQTCGQRTGGQCTHELVAVDVATGTTRWRRPGYQALAAAADGHLLVSLPEGERDDAAWVLRELRSGTLVPGQAWPAWETFLAGCCGEGEYRHVHRFGGVVVVVDGAEVRVWFGAGDGGPTRRVAVPPAPS